MKSVLLFFLFIITVFGVSKAQKCSRSGDFYNSTDIKTSGGVNVFQNKKGKLVIKINGDFKTQEGPDLDVYLSSTEKVGEGTSTRVDNLFSLEAAQRYVTSDPILLEEFEYVVIHCTKWNHWYGSAKLGQSSGCE